MKVAARPLLLEEVGQPFQPSLPRHRGPGPALGPVGAVQVLNLGEHLRLLQRRAQLLQLPAFQLAALLDQSKHLLPPLLQIAQIAQPLAQIPQHRVVQPAGCLLAVARDEGDGVPLIHQPHRALNLPPRHRKLLRQGLHHIHPTSVLSWFPSFHYTTDFLSHQIKNCKIILQSVIFFF